MNKRSGLLSVFRGDSMVQVAHDVFSSCSAVLLDLHPYYHHVIVSIALVFMLLCLRAGGAG